MEYRKFNYTNLEVSVLCLGTSQFGTSVPKELAFAQMDAFSGMGGNFLDTAHVYGDWGLAGKAISERIIGDWMKQKKNRGKIIISTKGGHPALSNMDTSRVCIQELVIDLQGSLDALQTDSIDIYFLHRDNPQTPVSLLIDWLESQRANGRIRYYGCSNWSLPRIIEAQKYSQSKGMDGFICNQIQDSLADMNIAIATQQQMVVADQSFFSYHSQTGMNLMAYMAIAHGYFFNKAANIALSDDDRELFDFPQNEKMLDAMRNMKPYSVNDISYQYILKRPYPSIPITGFDDLDQMADAINCCCKDIPIELIESVSKYKSSKQGSPV